MKTKDWSKLPHVPAPQEKGAKGETGWVKPETYYEELPIIMKEVAPLPNDIKIVNTAQDRFYNTDLDKALKAKGIKTLIMVGWKISGSVTYTSVGAMAHDYTVVVPIDTTSAGSDYETTIGFYNVLNSGNANLPNQPLKPNAVTLTRTDMITFQ